MCSEWSHKHLAGLLWGHISFKGEEREEEQGSRKRSRSRQQHSLRLEAVHHFLQSECKTGKKSMKMARQGTYEKKKVKKFFTAGHHIVLPLTAATTWQMMVLVKTLCLIRLTGCCNLDFVYVWLYTTLPALKKEREGKYHLHRNSLTY